jgi:hypothetical protein
MTGVGNDEQRIVLVRELRIPFLTHGRALMLAGGYAFTDIENESTFHGPRSGCCRWGFSGWRLSMATRILPSRCTGSTG